MQFIFYSCRNFERWDFRSSVEKGIGGSETSHVELCWRLAARGHTCISFVDLPEDQVSGVEWRGTKWYDKSEADFSLPGIWFLYRCPEMVDAFDRSRADQVLWLICQDYDYEDLWNHERIDGLDRIVPMCHWHLDMLLKKHPEMKDKLWVTRNAMKLDLVEEVEASGIPPRDPHRLMYTSSPDRGLLSSLKVFERVKEYVPDASLFATYGFNNLDKLIANGMSPNASPDQHAAALRFQKDKDECMNLVEKTGAHFLGRLDQRTLYKEWLKTSVFPYLTSFAETGWISGLEGQALGAIPVFSPVAAQGENTRFGVAVYGAPLDPATISRGAAEVVKLMKSPELQEEIRVPMMKYIRENWDWSEFVHKRPNENVEQAGEEDLKKRANRVTAPITNQLAHGLADNSDEVESRKRWLHLKDGDVFIDVGAADGAWSIPAAKQGATVFSLDLLAEWTKLDEQVEKAGVSDKVHPAEVFVLNNVGGNKKVSKGNIIRMVPVTTLDSFVMTEGISRVAMIKVDIEGSELEALQGSRGILTRDKPRLMVEVHCETVPGVSVSLESITKFLDGLDLGYVYEPVELTYHGKRYYHLFASVPENMAREILSNPKNYAFDWGGTLESNMSVREVARQLYYAGHNIHIVPAIGKDSKWDNDEFYTWALNHAGVPFTKIHRCSHPPTCEPEVFAEMKVKILKEIGADYFWDDNDTNIDFATKAGIPCSKVTPALIASKPHEPEIPPPGFILCCPEVPPQAPLTVEFHAAADIEAKTPITAGSDLPIPPEFENVAEKLDANAKASCLKSFDEIEAEMSRGLLSKAHALMNPEPRPSFLRRAFRWVFGEAP